jgi:hypothetical protein
VWDAMIFAAITNRLDKLAEVTPFHEELSR